MGQTADLPARQRGDMAIPGTLALVTLLLHLPVLARYGYHNDELYFIACGAHLDLGYVDHPPLVPWIAWPLILLGLTRLRAEDRRRWSALVAAVFVALAAVSMSLFALGRFQIPFGLLTSFTTSRLLYESLSPHAAGLDADSGLMVSGVAGDLDYGASFQSGMISCAEVARRGLYVGISGMVTFPKGDNIRDAARAVPAGRLLVETDSPYLAPVPHRGKRNEPALVRLVAESVAKVRGVGVDDLDRDTDAAFRALFEGSAGGKVQGAR
jgi:hypothetical protein